jgi:hypothetical protein
MIQRYDESNDEMIFNEKQGEWVRYSDLLASLRRVRERVATRERGWMMPPKSDRTEGRRAEDQEILAIIDEEIKGAENG